MGRRFGRNQRRKLRAAIERAQAETRAANILLNRARREAEQTAARHLDELRAARTARDLIRIDVDSFVDEQQRRLQVRARFDLLSDRARTPLYAAENIDMREMTDADRIEREAFVKLAGERIAQYVLPLIVQQWRSR